MKRFALLLVFAAVSAISPALRAQAADGKDVAQRPVCPPTANLDQLIKAIDAAVSGPGVQDRTCLRALFLPDARLMPLVKNKDDGSVAPRVLSVDGWIDAVAKRGTNVFYERQVKVTSEVYGHEAHLWSTYEVRPTPDGKPDVRGINSMQAVFDGKSWKLISIMWQAETQDEPVPGKYLP